MPENLNELVWWGFNGAWLLLLWFMKRDLSEIKNDTKENRKLQEANAIDIAQIKATCAERHRRGE